MYVYLGKMDKRKNHFEILGVQTQVRASNTTFTMLKAEKVDFEKSTFAASFSYYPPKQSLDLK